MNIQKIEYIYKDYQDDLLDQLRGKVFHVTSWDVFDSIQKSGFILHNKDERFQLNTASGESFGRNRGWVCFFDLRTISDEDLEWTLRKYYFLKPHWFVRYTRDDTVAELAYLILDDCVFRSIPATNSGTNRPPIPLDSGHPFRSIPATLKSYNL